MTRLGAGILWAVAGAALGAPALLRIPSAPDVIGKSQAEWAESLKVEPAFTNGLGMRFVLIPPGRFVMGPNGSTHNVTLSKPFYLAATEATLGQYRQYKPGHKIDGAADEFNADDRPVAMVSWGEAKAFCDWLSGRPEEKAAGRVYALPTEAQWEWAARAGTQTPRHFGEDDKLHAHYAVFNHAYAPNPKNEADGRGRMPVGKLKPNAWGLYDTLGNVWEWCAGRHADTETGELRDPVMRGGSWRSGGFHCTAVAHDPADPNARADNVGFRVLCRIPQAMK